MSEKNYSKIEIKTKENGNGLLTEVYIDGRKVSGVRGYNMEHFAGSEPVLTLDLIALDATVDESAVVKPNCMDGFVIKAVEELNEDD